MKPIRVKIVTPNDLLTAGHPIAIRCESWGSYPAAKIVWLLDGEPIRNAEVTLNNDKEVSATGSELVQRNKTKQVFAELLRFCFCCCSCLTFDSNSNARQHAHTPNFEQLCGA